MPEIFYHVQDVTLPESEVSSSSYLEPPTTRRKPSIAAKVTKKFNDVKKSLKNKKDLILDLDNYEEEEPQTRYLPERLEVLCEATGLDKQKMRSMYRAFKEECPNGAITEVTFRHIYSDGSAYAHYIFKALDKEQIGSLTFSDFVRGLARLVRGSLQERLHWVFRLYDIDHDGEISRGEMSAVVGAIHDLIGPSDVQSESHTNSAFQKLDLNSDGRITIDEFMACCYNDEVMRKSFAIFDECCFRTTL